jgi:anti-sigma regulatory factor (Ser/Thr protein kinase)
VGSVCLARHAIREQLFGRFDENTQMDAELMVSELVTNGVLHGPGGDAWIDVRLRLDASGLTVEVADTGQGFDPNDVPDPDPALPGGWGLTLVDRLADRWGTRRMRGRTAVWFRLNRMVAPNV